MAMTQCRECSKDVSKKAKKCPHCGVKEPGKSIMNRSIGGKFGLILIAAIGFFVVMSLAGDGTTSPSASTSAAPAAPPPVDESLVYNDIRYSMREAWTEAQFKAYARGVDGKRVRWTGWIDDVNEKLLGGYEIWIDMDPPTADLSTYDVSFDITAQQAMNLQKDRRIEFEGTIKNMMDIMGSLNVSLDDGKILP